MSFNAKQTKDKIIQWIKDWFIENGNECNAVIGISGGKDSSIVAALCVEALGKERVIGVLMPQHFQSDIQYSYDLVDHLGIQHCVINIGETVEILLMNMSIQEISVSEQTRINLPPRIRMATLYSVSQSLNGRVIGTSNLSENYIGFFTRWGDGVSDCEPLANLINTEVKLIGRELGLPEHLIEKAPMDGLNNNKTDEDIYGFTYEVLDKYIRTGICEDQQIKEKIDLLHEKNLFKLQPMPSFKLV